MSSDTQPLHILVLCTGNICRSPMGEALLAHGLRERGVDVVLSSAGLVLQGKPASPHALSVLNDRGIDHAHHRSRIIDTGIIESADLILAMTREHLREAAVVSPSALSRTFTLKELVRSAEARGRRPRDIDLATWLEALASDRQHEQLLGASADDDVADPYGMDRADYERTCAEIESLVTRLLNALWPVTENVSS